jgi:hypothetical protein
MSVDEPCRRQGAVDKSATAVMQAWRVPAGGGAWSGFLLYNFARFHQTASGDASMEAGIADHVRTIQEIVGLLSMAVSRGHYRVGVANAEMGERSFPDHATPRFARRERGRVQCVATLTRRVFIKVPPSPARLHHSARPHRPRTDM